MKRIRLIELASLILCVVLPACRRVSEVRGLLEPKPLDGAALYEELIALSRDPVAADADFVTFVARCRRAADELPGRYHKVRALEQALYATGWIRS